MTNPVPKTVRDDYFLGFPPDFKTQEETITGH